MSRLQHEAFLSCLLLSSLARFLHCKNYDVQFCSETVLLCGITRGIVFRSTGLQWAVRPNIVLCSITSRVLDRPTVCSAQMETLSVSNTKSTQSASMSSKTSGYKNYSSSFKKFISCTTNVVGSSICCLGFCHH